MFNFEKLEVWQKGIEFADLVYSLTRSFPAEERFGLTNQMRRAAVSVSSNVRKAQVRAALLNGGDEQDRRIRRRAEGLLVERQPVG